MSQLDNIHFFLSDFGLWTLFVFVLLKFVTGVAVAIQNNEFKWFYVGEFLKNDVLKFVVVAAVSIALDPAMAIALGAALTADLWGGIAKNIAHFFPAFAEKAPTSVREPARLRLGNNKNTK